MQFLDKDHSLKVGTPRPPSHFLLSFLSRLSGSLPLSADHNQPLQLSSSSPIIFLPSSSSSPLHLLVCSLLDLEEELSQVGNLEEINRTQLELS